MRPKPRYKLPVSESAAPFDPRLAPVLRTDAHLPCVPPSRLSPAALRAHFAALARTAWPAPAAGPAQGVAAAVLVALVMRPSGLTVLLTQRSAHLPTHAGQIAFAGGKVDPTDAHVQATAVREAQEELGLCPSLVEPIGALPGCTSGAGFCISPIVALVKTPLKLRPNPGEVADVFEVPLGFVMNPAHHRHHAHTHLGQLRHWLSMPYPPLPANRACGPNERFIWGATAGILQSFYQQMWVQPTAMEA